MPLTELAHLRLLPPTSSISPLLPTILHHLSTASEKPFRYYRRTDSELELYLFGHWDDLAHHQRWLESETNQRLLREAEGKMEVIDMFHVDVCIDQLELGERVWVGQGGEGEGWNKVVEREGSVKWAGEKGEGGVWMELSEIVGGIL
ncbi:hypothetical protein BDD12DRAFT_815643 [Trichophaea hybrida]|nr:hypothetical protein BDD12DRAFT_815643 [Trichophaea hybrida]